MKRNFRLIFSHRLIKTHLISIIISRSIFCTTSCLHDTDTDDDVAGMAHFKFILLRFGSVRFANLSKWIKVSLRMYFALDAAAACIVRSTKIVTKKKFRWNAFRNSLMVFDCAHMAKYCVKFFLSNWFTRQYSRCVSSLSLSLFVIVFFASYCHFICLSDSFAISFFRFLQCPCILYVSAIWSHHCMTWCNFQFCVKAQTKYYKQSPSLSTNNGKNKDDSI